MLWRRLRRPAPVNPPALARIIRRGRIPASRPPPVLPRARGARARALARERRLRALARSARGGGDLELLRGAADGERKAACRTRALPRLQGHLPALPHDARLPSATQGRLGLPRIAGRARGRAGARDLLEGRDRGVRNRGVQRPLPGVGVLLRRGLEPADRANRLLDRPRRRLPDPREPLYRVGLVGAPRDLGGGPPLPGPQGRAVLPALRDGAVIPRGGPGLPRRGGPVGLREDADPRARAQRRDP